MNLTLVTVIKKIHMRPIINETEEKIKVETKATIRCIPLDTKTEKGKCIFSQEDSPRRVLFAKSY